MSRLFKYIVCFLFVLSIFVSGYSQSLKQLKSNRNKIEKEIKYLNKLLKEGSISKKHTLNRLVIVGRQINNREKLVKNIEKGINILQVDIKNNRKCINKHSLRLNKLKENYSSIIYSSWLHKSRVNKFIFILSANDFNQAYLRLKYLKQYSFYTNQLYKKIGVEKKSLQQETSILKQKVAAKLGLVHNISSEKLALAREKQKHSDLLYNLNSQQRNLKKKLKKQLNIQERLSKEISRVIKLELSKKRKKNSSYSSLSKKFYENRGKLPWPTKSGFISSKFGIHNHPIAKRTKVKNDGIDITVSKNTKCYAVFTGIVSEVFNFPGLNNIVMVRHGSYLSVYANLCDVYVRKGDKIKTNQPIGSIFTDDAEGKTILKFQIWKNSSKQNPEKWLSK